MQHERHDTDTPRGRSARGRRVPTASLALVAAFALGACASDAPRAEEATPVGFTTPTGGNAVGDPPETMPTDPVEFDDGLHHVVVVTETNPGLGLTEPNTEDANGAAPASGS